jgi:hypothetical protein
MYYIYTGSYELTYLNQRIRRMSSSSSFNKVKLQLDEGLNKYMSKIHGIYGL